MRTLADEQGAAAQAATHDEDQSDVMDDDDDGDDGDDDDDAGEKSPESSSSDTAGSSGKSGGGYSADCSASDQSSDDAGGDGGKSSKGTGSSSQHVNLSLSQLAVNDEDDMNMSRPSSAHGIDTAGDELTVENDRKLPAAGTDKMKNKTSTLKKPPPSSSHHHHHSKSRKKKELTAGEQAATEARAVEKRNKKISSQQKLSMKSPDAIDIDAILKTKSQHEAENSALLAGHNVLPQWNGVRVAHPMDPRIDLSKVSLFLQPNDTYHMPAPLQPMMSVVFPPPAKTAAAAPASMPAPSQRQCQQQEQQPQPLLGDENEQVPTIESYKTLMEMVRPFFHAQGVPVNQSQFPLQSGSTMASYPKTAMAEAAISAAAQQSTSGSDKTQVDTSEGFTSFFTTTNSGTGSNTTNSRRSAQASKGDKKPKARENHEQAVDADGADADYGSPSDRENYTDSSSMVVLARVRRKHRNSNDGGPAEESSNSASQRTRCVRIQEAAAAGAAAAADQQQPHARPEDAGEEEADGADANPSSDNSSASNNHGKRQDVDALRLAVPPLPPRIVTDVSSSNRTDSNSNTNTASSGSGSAGNTGSGSNHGSSASGNEGKGSSEDLAAQEVNSGESPLDGSDQSDIKKVAHAPALPAPEDQVMHDSNDGAARERKLLDKKRKRIEMRREYEAQQQVESSESSNGKSEQLLRPGRPVTLDQVLQFSKIARIIILATPPFLVVHTNAAYSRLTGNDSHTVVGRPIETLLALPDKSHAKTTSTPREENGSVKLENPQSSDLAGANADMHLPAAAAPPPEETDAAYYDVKMPDLGLERLVAASGFGRLQVLHAVSKQHQMLGRSVSFQHGAPPIKPTEGVPRKYRDDPNSSLSSTPDQTRHIPCRVSIAPVVSSQAGLEGSVVTDKESDVHKTKRRKLHGGHEPEPLARKAAPLKEHRRHQHRQLVTHYVIQLEHDELGQRHGSVGSLSSLSSVEARLLGLTKAELKRQRLAATDPSPVESEMQVEEEEELASETTDTMEPPHVSAIG